MQKQENQLVRGEIFEDEATTPLKSYQHRGMNRYAPVAGLNKQIRGGGGGGGP